MQKYIDSEKLIAEIQKRIEETKSMKPSFDQFWAGQISAFKGCLNLIDSLQQEQPENMIQWTGKNLKEVIDFTGKSPRFEEWFKSWEEFETYVHQHNDILKLFCEDGSHFEVPVGAWIVKTPDGYNVPSVAKYVKQEQPEVDLEKEIDEIWNPRFNLGWDEKSLLSINRSAFETIARHFYELGLKAGEK